MQPGLSFESENTAIACIEAEVKMALPDGWTCHRRLQYRYQCLPEAAVRMEHTEWKLAPRREPHQAPSNDYLLRLDAGLRIIAVVHGNTDKGGSAFNWMLQKATLLHVQDLQYYPLHDFLRHLLASASPNTWGLS